MSVQFELVSPERRLASLIADDVQIPGADGDLTAMAGHVPTITTLRPGILRVGGAAGGDQAFVVTGGFAEIRDASVSILAERAVSLDEMTEEVFENLVVDLSVAVTLAEDKDLAEKAVADLMAIKSIALR